MAKLQATIDDALYAEIEALAKVQCRTIPQMTQIMLARVAGKEFIHLVPRDVFGSDEKQEGQ
jgi:hypothetical protein